MPRRRALKILECGSPVLRQRAEPVSPDDLKSRELKELILRMRVTMEEAPGVGLAAPQVGESVQLAVLADGPQHWGSLEQEDLLARDRTELPFTVIVNPVLRVLDGPSASFYEGCLSVPGLMGVVARHLAVRVECLDANGEPLDLVLSGWPARIAQHEIDHLNGVLYLDRTETRSLSTVDAYHENLAGQSREDVAALLGFKLGVDR